MSAGNPQTIDRVARYLDGVLDGEELAQFERALETDADLRHELELQERLDDSLRRVMPYTAREIRFEAEQPAVIARIGPWRRMGRLAAAAAVLLGAAIAINILTRERVPVVPPEQVYARLVGGGFKPEFVCTTDEEFAKAIHERLGQGLVARAAESVSLIGWAYNRQYEGKLIGFRTLVLMARVEGQPVLVLMDRASEDRAVSVPEGSGLRVFRRRIGDLVCYEVTPRERPAVLELLYDPDRPPGG